MIDLIKGKTVTEAQKLASTFTGMIKGVVTDEESLEELEDALSAVLHLERLGEYDAFDPDGNAYRQSDVLSHLQHCLTGDLHPVRVPDTPMYLDAILASEELVGGIVPRLGSRHLAMGERQLDWLWPNGD